MNKIDCYSHEENLYNVGPPGDVCWFRFAPVTSSLFAYHVYHSEIGVMCTNLAIERGPHFVENHIALVSHRFSHISHRDPLPGAAT